MTGELTHPRPPIPRTLVDTSAVADGTLAETRIADLCGKALKVGGDQLSFRARVLLEMILIEVAGTRKRRESLGH